MNGVTELKALYFKHLMPFLVCVWHRCWNTLTTVCLVGTVHNCLASLPHCLCLFYWHVLCDAGAYVQSAREHMAPFLGLLLIADAVLLTSCWIEQRQKQEKLPFTPFMCCAKRVRWWGV